MSYFVTLCTKSSILWMLIGNFVLKFHKIENFFIVSIDRFIMLKYTVCLLLMKEYIWYLFIATRLQCKVKADIVILNDASRSVHRYGRQATGDNNYYRNYVYTLLKDIIDYFPINGEDARMALIMFGNERPEVKQSR